MATMVTAAESTANTSASGQVRDVAKTLAYLDPEAAPFTLITMEGDKRVADNFKFEWPEKANRPLYDAVNGTTGTGTSIIVDNGSYFRVGDLVKVARTAEVFRVTAISTNTLTVVRGVGSTATAAVADNDDLFIIGSGYAEGAAVGTEQTHQETWLYNYTQIFRDPFGATRTQQNTRNYLGDNRTRQRKEMSKEHRIHIEQSFLFGERNTDVSSTAAPRHYSGGFLYWATSNALAVGGTLTEAEVWTWCESLFAHTAGGNSRTVYASALACSVIDMIAGARLQTVPKDQTYGIAVKQWVTSHGTLNIVKHRLLVNGAVSSQGYGGYMLACEPSTIAYRYLANSDTNLLTDRQAPGDDKWTDEYLTECGLEFKNPELHGVATGLTG